MALNPDVQENLRQEIFRAMDKEGGEVTWDLVSFMINEIIQRQESELML